MVVARRADVVQLVYLLLYSYPLALSRATMLVPWQTGSNKLCNCDAYDFSVLGPSALSLALVQQTPLGRKYVGRQCRNSTYRSNMW